MTTYRVESNSTDTGITRPNNANHHEFTATSDEDAVRIATAYATSQHGPGTRSRVFRQEFLGWIPVKRLVTPCRCGNHTCTDAPEGDPR